MPLERGYLVGCQAEGGKFFVGAFFGGYNSGFFGGGLGVFLKHDVMGGLFGGVHFTGNGFACRVVVNANCVCHYVDAIP